MRRVLLDNCLDRRLGDHLPGFEVVHVLDLGGERLGGSTLVRMAAEGFDVRVTVDRNMASQVNLARLALAVVVLRVPTNRLKDCLLRVLDLLEAILLAEPGRFTLV